MKDNKNMKLNFTEEDIEKMYKGGMIKQDTYERAKKYACGGKVQKYAEGGAVQDPVLQDKISAAIENTLQQAKNIEIGSNVPDKNYDPNIPAGMAQPPVSLSNASGYLAKSLGVPGAGSLEKTTVANISEPVAQEQVSDVAPSPKMIEGSSIDPNQIQEEQRAPTTPQMVMPTQGTGATFIEPSLKAFDDVKKQMQDQLEEQQARSLQRDQEIQKEKDKLDQAKELVMKGAQIDPNRYWGNKSTGQKLAAGFAIFLGGLGRGNNRNMVLEQLNNAINRDIDAQKEQATKAKSGYEMQNNIYSQMMKQFDNETQRDTATRSMMLNLANLELNKVASMTNSQQAKQNAELLRAQIQNEQIKAQSAFNEASRLYGAGAVADDMAKKIMTNVPKEFREKAFGELGKYKEIQSQVGRVKQIMNDIRKTTTVTSNIPFTDAKSLADKAEADLFPVVKAIVGERMTDADARLLIKSQAPKITDSDKVVAKKTNDMIEALLARIPGETAFLESFGVVTPRKQIDFKPR